MSIFDKYAVVKLDNQGPFVMYKNFDDNDSQEVKFAKTAEAFGYDPSTVQYIREDVNDMHVDHIVTIIENYLENENYHSMISLPGNLATTLKRTFPEPAIREVIIALSDELTKMG